MKKIKDWCLRQIKDAEKQKIFYFSVWSMLITYFTCCYANAITGYSQRLNIFLLTASFGMLLLGLVTEGYKKRLIIGNAVILVGIFAAGLCNFFSLEKQSTVLAVGMMVISFVFLFVVSYKKYTKNHPVFLFFYIALMCGMIIFRNGRYWMLFLVAAMGLWYALKIKKERRILLFIGMSNGVIWTNTGLLILAMAFRPFDRDRYFGMFSTVCNFSFLLSLVVVCVLLRIAGTKRKGWTVLWYTYISITFGFLMLSGTRTSLVAVAVILIFYFIMHQSSVYRYSIKQMLLRIFAGLLGFLIAFPLCFLAARWLPTILNRPYWFGGEYDEYRVTSMDPPDSPKYARFDRYFAELVNKTGIFYIPYHETKEGSLEQLEEVSKATGISVEELVEEAAEKEKELSLERLGNGRVEVYSAYADRLNLEGHKGDNLENWEEIDYYHAHNSYLQFFYNFGAIAGIIFLLFCGTVFVFSILYYRRHKDETLYAMFPLLCIALFGISSAMENTLSPFYILGFFFYFTIKFVVEEEESEGDVESHQLL